MAAGAPARPGEGPKSAAPKNITLNRDRWQESPENKALSEHSLEDPSIKRAFGRPGGRRLKFAGLFLSFILDYGVFLF
jgi:hypothetical protein